MHSAQARVCVCVGGGGYWGQSALGGNVRGDIVPMGTFYPRAECPGVNLEGGTTCTTTPVFDSILVQTGHWDRSACNPQSKQKHQACVGEASQATER